MGLNLSEKQAVVAETSAEVAKAQVIVVAEYRGLEVGKITALRKQAQGCRQAQLLAQGLGRGLGRAWTGRRTAYSRQCDTQRGTPAALLRFNGGVGHPRSLSMLGRPAGRALTALCCKPEAAGPTAATRLPESA